jgi:CheY-like chemotaxis protein
MAKEPPAVSFRSPTTPITSAGAQKGVPSLRLKVLVVDDNRDAADTLAGLLLLCGADVRVCYGGEAGIREAEAFQPDVGLFDVNMPWVNGCALAARARAAAGGRPLLLVAITGISDEGAVGRTIGAGFNIHLTKPADPTALVATLADFDWWLRARSAAPSGG